MRLNPNQRYLQSITVTLRSCIQAGETREKSYGLAFLPFRLRMTSSQCDSERRGLLRDAFDEQRAPFKGQSLSRCDRASKQEKVEKRQKNLMGSRFSRFSCV